MTTNRQFADSEGVFEQWRDHTAPCSKTVPIVGSTGGNTHACIGTKPCGAKVRYRCWESSDGGYEDYQYRCENGHTWWVDGIDS